MLGTKARKQYIFQKNVPLGKKRLAVANATLLFKKAEDNAKKAQFEVSYR